MTEKLDAKEQSPNVERRFCRQYFYHMKVITITTQQQRQRLLLPPRVTIRKIIPQQHKKQQRENNSVLLLNQRYSYFVLSWDHCGLNYSVTSAIKVQNIYGVFYSIIVGISLSDP